MTARPDLDLHLQRERAIEAARSSFHAAEAARAGGVGWSGLGPSPIARRGPLELAAAAEARLAASAAWRASPQGAFLTAIADVQAALLAAHAAAEQARSAAARGLAGEQGACGRWLREIDVQTRRLRQGLARARRALGGPASG